MPAAARDLSEVPDEVRSGPTVVSGAGHFLVHRAESGPHAITAKRARKLAPAFKAARAAVAFPDDADRRHRSQL